MLTTLKRVIVLLIVLTTPNPYVLRLKLSVLFFEFLFCLLYRSRGRYPSGKVQVTYNCPATRLCLQFTPHDEIPPYRYVTVCMAEYLPTLVYKYYEHSYVYHHDYVGGDVPIAPFLLHLVRYMYPKTRQ